LIWSQQEHLDFILHVELAFLAPSLIKVIPQYCTAHPVLHITCNWQQNIMALFLLEILHVRKIGILERHGQKKRWKFFAEKEKKAE